MKTFDRQKMFIQDWNKPIAVHLRDYSQTHWDWNRINWKKIESKVFYRKKRIYKATKIGQTQKTKSLIKLLSRSACTVILGVRRVTQDSMGKRSSGIDGLKYLTPKARERLAKRLFEVQVFARKNLNLEWNGQKTAGVIIKPNRQKGNTFLKQTGNYGTEASQLKKIELSSMLLNRL